MAINHAAIAAFDAAEAFWESKLPGYHPDPNGPPICGCQFEGEVAEDGSMVGWPKDNTVAVCDNGTCRSKFNGKTFACGTMRCPTIDYCLTEVPGTDGGAPSYGCQPFQNRCDSCDCFGLGGGCQCSSGPDGITITCAEP
jgi:hypothetical protein